MRAFASRISTSVLASSFFPHPGDIACGANPIVFTLTSSACCGISLGGFAVFFSATQKSPPNAEKDCFYAHLIGLLWDFFRRLCRFF